MSMMRKPRVPRSIACLVLVGSLALTWGCSEPNPATSVSPEEAKAKGEAMKNAMQKEFGPSGVPSAKKPAAKK